MFGTSFLLLSIVVIVNSASIDTSALAKGFQAQVDAYVKQVTENAAKEAQEKIAKIQSQLKDLKVGTTLSPMTKGGLPQNPTLQTPSLPQESQMTTLQTPSLTQQPQQPGEQIPAEINQPDQTTPQATIAQSELPVQSGQGQAQDSSNLQNNRPGEIAQQQ